MIGGMITTTKWWWWWWWWWSWWWWWWDIKLSNWLFEDSLANLELALGERRLPDTLPKVLDLDPVLVRAAAMMVIVVVIVVMVILVMVSERHDQQTGQEEHAQHHSDRRAVMEHTHTVNKIECKFSTFTVVYTSWSDELDLQFQSVHILTYLCKLLWTFLLIPENNWEKNALRTA